MEPRLITMSSLDPGIGLEMVGGYQQCTLFTE